MKPSSFLRAPAFPKSASTHQTLPAFPNLQKTSAIFALRSDNSLGFFLNIRKHPQTSLGLLSPQQTAPVPPCRAAPPVPCKEQHPRCQPGHLVPASARSKKSFSPVLLPFTAFSNATDSIQKYQSEAGRGSLPPLPWKRSLCCPLLQHSALILQNKTHF